MIFYVLGYSPLKIDMRFKTDGTYVTFKRRETLYLYVLYYPPVHNANRNESREIIIMKKFNAFAIS